MPSVSQALCRVWGQGVYHTDQVPAVPRLVASPVTWGTGKYFRVEFYKAVTVSQRRGEVKGDRLRWRLMREGPSGDRPHERGERSWGAGHAVLGRAQPPRHGNGT